MQQSMKMHPALKHLGGLIGNLNRVASATLKGMKGVDIMKTPEGAVRYEVEWITDKPDYTGSDPDPDLDTVANVKYFTSKKAAMAAARQIKATTDLTWGVVSVFKQVYMLTFPEYGLYDWENTKEEWEVG